MRKSYNIDEAYNAYMEQYNKIKVKYDKIGEKPLFSLDKNTFERALNSKIDSIKASGGRPSSKVKLAKTIANQYGYKTTAERARQLKNIAEQAKNGDLIGFVTKVFGDTISDKYGYSFSHFGISGEPGLKKYVDEAFNAKTYNKQMKAMQNIQDYMEKLTNTPQDKLTIDMYFYPSDNFDMSSVVPLGDGSMLSTDNAPIQERISLDSEKFTKLIDTYTKLGNMSISQIRLHTYNDAVELIGLDQLSNLYTELKKEYSSAEAAAFIARTVFGSK